MMKAENVAGKEGGKWVWLFFDNSNNQNR